MVQYKRLLLIADPALKRTAAFERATWLAQVTGAELHMALFSHAAAIDAVALVNADAANRAAEGLTISNQRWLDEQATLLRQKGLRVTTQAVRTRSPREDMVAYINEFDADLVVKDVRHVPAIKRLVLTPLDWQLLRESRRNVLLVHPLSHAVPKRVAAAVDPMQLSGGGADLDQRVVDAARAMALQCNAELHVAHAANTLAEAGVGFVGVVPVFPTDLIEELGRTHKANLERFAKTHGIPDDRTHLLSGAAQDTLPVFADKQGVDVLAIGSAQRHGFDRLMLGSTAESILDALPCDALVVVPA